MTPSLAPPPHLQAAVRLGQQRLVQAQVEAAGERVRAAAATTAAQTRQEFQMLDADALRCAPAAHVRPIAPHPAAAMPAPVTHSSRTRHHTPLRRHTRARERCDRVQRQVTEAASELDAELQRVAAAAAELAELQVAPTLVSDTELKLARQAYFTAKQNKVCVVVPCLARDRSCRGLPSHVWCRVSVWH